MKTKLSLGFSPCPNDTFMFDAIVHGKVDTEGLEFDVVMTDVEVLNIKAIRRELDVSKISFAAFTKVTDEYRLLASGSALGNGVGPLLISKFEFPISDLSKLSIAIPGQNTTANFIFSVFFPEAMKKTEIVFSEIEDSVLSGQVEAGVIIHENRFTYEKRGLKKIADLGELWEKETGQPIPLGGIAVKKSLPEEIKQQVNRVIRRSVEYAFTNPESSYEYVKKNAQEMDEDVRRKHIALYVNEFSVDLGERGKKAIEVFFHKALQAGIINFIPENIFVNNIVEFTNG
ncbi:MAG: 1,4-dihydroxy-6-naphthoate synthase [Bacteroidia bacterium]|nr:1,4-dihydroxy-6-naphthoate synthase [Bacteroidia bacterium]